MRAERPTDVSPSSIELRGQTLHLLSGDQGPPAQVPPRNVAVQRTASCYLYVRLLFVDSTQQQARAVADSYPPFSWFLSRIDLIDKATKEIKQDEDKTVYKSLDEIADDLPDHSPRFVLLSYPMTLVRPSPRN